MPSSAYQRFAAAEPAALAGPVPDLDLRTGSYRVRFARDEADVERACRLRFEVFNRELGEGLAESWAAGLDRDRFDAQCQHLLVETADGREVVGTYRLQAWEQAAAGHGFYSAGEFLLEELPEWVLHESVELGRACVAREHRNTLVLFALWRGLASYVLWHRKRFFFGCNSLTSQSEEYGLRTWRHLREHGHVHPEFRLQPRPEVACRPGRPDPEAERPVAIPRLFGIYLRYGGKVCGPPALDRDFKTVDFFTILDLAAMDEETFVGFLQEDGA